MLSILSFAVEAGAQIGTAYSRVGLTTKTRVLRRILGLKLQDAPHNICLKTVSVYLNICLAFFKDLFERAVKISVQHQKLSQDT